MYALKMRRNPTEAEACMWKILQPLRLRWTIKQSYVIGPYIADFWIKEANLVIEVDGGYHDAPLQKAKDEVRTAYLKKQFGARVIRFRNEHVLDGDPKHVLRRVYKALLRRV